MKFEIQPRRKGDKGIIANVSTKLNYNGKNERSEKADKFIRIIIAAHKRLLLTE